MAAAASPARDDAEGDARPAATLEGSLVQWVNSVLRWAAAERANDAVFATHVEAVAQLANGVILFHLLHHCAPSDFDLAGAALDASSPVLAVNNVRKLVQALERFFVTHNVFNMGGEKLDLGALLNISAVSQGEHAEITKLVEFALVAAVNSSHREGVVECIMALDEGSQTQHRLMFIINDVTERHAATDEARVSAAAAQAHPQAEQLAAEVKGLSGRVQELEADAADAKARADRLAGENKELRRAEAELTDRLRDAALQHAQELAALQAKAKRELEDAVAAEVSKAKRTAAQLTAQAAELEAELAEARRSGEAQTRQLSEQLDEARRENSKLRDEVDIAADKSKKLIAAEATIERFKQRIAESAAATQRVQELEAQRASDLERLAALEAQAGQATTLKQQMSRLREQVAQAQEAAEEAQRAEQRLQDEVRYLKELRGDEQRKLAEERDAAIAEVAALKAAAAHAGGTAAAAQAEDAELRVLRERTARLEAELRQAREEAEAALADSGVELRAENERLRRQNRALADQTRDLSLQLVKAQNPSQPAAPTETAGARELAEQVASLKRQLQESQSEGAALRAKHQELAVKAREGLQSRNRRIEELEARLAGAGAGASPAGGDVARLLRKQLDDALAEIQLLKDQKNEYKEMTKRELALMSSAFFELGTQYHTTLAGGKRAPSGAASGASPHRSSWINLQRQRTNPHA